MSAPVIFTVPTPAAREEALPPLEAKFTVPVLLTITSASMKALPGCSGARRCATNVVLPAKQLLARTPALSSRLRSAHSCLEAYAQPAASSVMFDSQSTG